MDIRAFGSVYGQQSQLPYASGFVWHPDDGETTFTTCRALFVESPLTVQTRDDFFVRLNDMAENTYLHVENIAGDTHLNFGAVALSGGSVEGIVVLY